MIDCSNIPVDVMEGTFETPQTLKLNNDDGRSFELSPTEAMCNHPAVTAPDPTPAPTEIYYPTYCGDAWSFGDIVEGECYSLDTGFCVTEYDNCIEISQGWSFYNQLYDDEYMPIGPYTVYGYISAYADTCNDICIIDVEGYECDCSLNGTSLTMEACNSTLDGYIETPQTVDLPGGNFRLISTDEMCNHPAVIAETDGSNRQGSGIGKQRNGALVLKFPASLTFQFEYGTGSALDFKAKTLLFSGVMKFMGDSLREHDRFKDTLFDATMEQIDIDYDISVSPDEWIVSFETIISLEPGTKAHQRDCIMALADADWDGYLSKYVHQIDEHSVSRLRSNKSDLDKIRKVKFRAIGTGNS
ncbi:expressed unknown protein [Seminavis robusta]|uniref:Uncharacterized protein n=1 Tax=Seminavis robusta TaxID=568900 RepID=A0A9N8E8E0_9STRA|nr:expressed unknown protein [Seminavis robusta]|eukprot:Sro733_g194550.1 n/a (358) ;mRNA; f:23058-24131